MLLLWAQGLFVSFNAGGTVDNNMFLDRSALGMPKKFSKQQSICAYT